MLATCPECGHSADYDEFEWSEGYDGDGIGEFLTCPECGHRGEHYDFVDADGDSSQG